VRAIARCTPERLTLCVATTALVQNWTEAFISSLNWHCQRQNEGDPRRDSEAEDQRRFRASLFRKTTAHASVVRVFFLGFVQPLNEFGDLNNNND